MTSPLPATDSANAPPFADDAQWVSALRAGDEAALAALPDRYHGPLVRLAQWQAPHGQRSGRRGSRRFHRFLVIGQEGFGVADSRDGLGQQAD